MGDAADDAWEAEMEQDHINALRSQKCLAPTRDECAWESAESDVAWEFYRCRKCGAEFSP